MVDDRHLEKSKNVHVSATVSPIGTKFSRLTHISSLNRIGS